MRAYLLRRLLQLIPLLLGILTLTFLLMQLAPGDFLSTVAADPTVSAEALAAMRRQFGLDRPPLVQYGLYLLNLLHGDFGQSFARHQPVFTVLRAALGNTLLLAIAAALITWGLAIPLGVMAAVRRNRWPDRLTSGLALVGLSIPEVLSGLLLLLLAARTGWFPVGGMHSLDWERLGPGQRSLDVLRHLALPALVVGLTPLAARMRQMRASLLDVLRLEFVVTARAKGLRERTVVAKHALRNALNPMLTLFGYTLGGLVSGSFVAEVIFAWPGLGRITIEAILSHDQYLVLGAVIMASTVLVGGNLVADLLLALVDPRIRYERR
jgi:peptide/nickel transport system permease protein